MKFTYLSVFALAVLFVASFFIPDTPLAKELLVGCVVVVGLGLFIGTQHDS